MVSSIVPNYVIYVKRTRNLFCMMMMSLVRPRKHSPLTSHFGATRVLEQKLRDHSDLPDLLANLLALSVKTAICNRMNAFYVAKRCSLSQRIRTCTTCIIIYGHFNFVPATMLHFALHFPIFKLTLPRKSFTIPHHWRIACAAFSVSETFFS